MSSSRRRVLGALDQREHVAHAEDARRHAVGVEPLERVELLADGGELDRLAGDRLDGERRAAARVAVELRHHDAVEVDPLLERLGDVDGLLAGHRVEHEQHVRRLRLAADRRELLHQRLVDLQPAGGVEDHDVALRRPSPARCRRARPCTAIAPLVRVDRDADLPAELDQLLDRGGPLEVGSDERRALAVLLEQQRELAGGGRLARALQAGEQDRSSAAAARRRASTSRSPSARSAPRGRSSRPAGRGSGSSGRPGRARARGRGRRTP